MIIRNPYERVISGFREKYHKNDPYRKFWHIDKPITFKNFVEEMIHNKDTIEIGHFLQQTSGDFDNRLSDAPKLFVYDINNVDIKFI